MIQYRASTETAPHDSNAERERRIAAYSEEYAKHSREFGIKPANPAQRLGPVLRPVYCHDLHPKEAATRGPDQLVPSACFFSPVDAAKHFATQRQNILYAMRFGTGCSGTRFDPILEAPSFRAKMGNERKVLCVDQDIQFDTLTQAARWAKIASSTMHYGIKSKRAIGIAGHTFRFVDAPPTARI